MLVIELSFARRVHADESTMSADTHIVERQLGLVRVTTTPAESSTLNAAESSLYHATVQNCKRDEKDTSTNADEILMFTPRWLNTMGLF